MSAKVLKWFQVGEEIPVTATLVKAARRKIGTETIEVEGLPYGGQTFFFEEEHDVFADFFLYEVLSEVPAKESPSPVSLEEACDEIKRLRHRVTQFKNALVDIEQASINCYGKPTWQIAREALEVEAKG